MMSFNRIVLTCAIVLATFFNYAFFRNLLQIYPLGLGNAVFLVSIWILVIALTCFLLGLSLSRKVLKPLLLILFPVSAGASYFMNTYNIVVDTSMIRNILETDAHEAVDLLSLRLLLWLILGGIMPAVLVIKVRIEPESWLCALRRRSQLLAGSLSVMLLCLLSSTSHYASFFREHKILRYYTNPVTVVYSGIRYSHDNFAASSVKELRQIGLGAHIPEEDHDRELIIMVVGETARADHFSLNGYSRQTNPLLERKQVMSFTDMESCGTSTAVSVPCMFALQGSEGFDVDESRQIENLLDVLDHADVSLLWRDNNSDSKGVAHPDIYENFRSRDLNPVCDVECRDVGMLANLDNYIAAIPGGDIFIVLHQMGNHGPAYSHRYPIEFEQFTPACQSNQLETCSITEIINAYDNAILYTDYFLSQVIGFLEKYDDHFETAMLYVSDHGESLGEHGLYLHGLPSWMAPPEQTRVASIMWLGQGFSQQRETVVANTGQPVSHDNIFHTVLSLMEIRTNVFDATMDLLRYRLDGAGQLAQNENKQ